MADDTSDSVQPPAVAAETPAARRTEASAPDLDDVEVLSRFLAGLLLLGSDELLRRLRDLQRAINANPDILWQTPGRGRGTALDPILDLTMGLYMRGQRKMVQGVRRGFSLSVGATNWFLTTADRLTDNRLARPFRRRLAMRLDRAQDQVRAIRSEGRSERQQSRLLAAATVSQIVDDMITYISEDPEFNRVLQNQLSRQSKGMAGVVADNSRALTVASDNLAERVVRKLLHLPPRQALPPSPFVGEPQTMYSLDVGIAGEDYDEP